VKGKCIILKNCRKKRVRRYDDAGNYIGNQTYLRNLYEKTHGPIDEPEMVVVQGCGNEDCHNPDHLILKSLSDHFRDIVVALDPPVGEKNPNAKLTDEIVLRLRALKKKGRLQRGDISRYARQYGVHKHTMQKAVNGQYWNHIQI
jgi:hypothetical protein